MTEVWLFAGHRVLAFRRFTVSVQTSLNRRLLLFSCLRFSPRRQIANWYGGSAILFDLLVLGSPRIRTETATSELFPERATRFKTQIIGIVLKLSIQVGVYFLDFT
jgi:hypothetical protein